MDGVLNLLPLYVEDQNGELSLGQFLETCRTHQSFNQLGDAGKQNQREGEHDHALGIINSKLNNSDSRIEGALLLDALVPQCRTETFTAHCVSWVQQVMKLLQGPAKLEGGATGCIVLSKLLTFASQFPDASRQISSNIISPLVTSLCDAEFMQKSYISEHILKCLQCCMKHFHGACGPAKGTIERHLLSMVDLNDMAVDSGLRSSWAECFALLPGLGGSGPGGAQHKTNWSELCSQLINSIHGSVNGLFRNIQEIKTYEVAATNSLKLGELSHQNPMVLLHLERRRLINLCSALAFLLKEPFTASKTVPLDQILDLISRFMALNSKSLSKSSRANFELLTLGSIIPDLQAAALEVLTSLVGACRSQLITRASTVMNLHVQVLQWTFTPFEDRHAASERPFGKLRVQVYKSLCAWLAASRSACGLTKHADALSSQLLSDVVVHRETVQLLSVNPASGGGQTGSGKKGKKKQLLDNQTGGLILRKADQGANADVCQAALQCLTLLLLYCGPRIKPAIHKEVQEVVLSILMELTKGGQARSLLPYNDPNCRAGLYKVLEKLILCPSPYWPAPLNYATAVFNSGLNDPNLEVSVACAEGLVSMQSILRPRGPSLNLAMDVKNAGFVQLREQPDQRSSALVPSQADAAVVAAVAHRNGAETPPPEPLSQPSGAEHPLSASPPLPSVQIRGPEDSPIRALPAPDAPVNNGDVYATPLSGVTSLTRMEVTPMNEERALTRTEALKVIASAHPPALEVKSSPASDRKRPSAEPAQSPRHEKILKELPYGADAVDDDVESMLASFQDVPAE